MDEAILEMEGVSKRYGQTVALRDVSLALAPGETVALLGPSGSGKTTLLRVVAGLEEADSGRICWKGENLVHTPVHRRRFGMVFQDYALFPHKNVAENVAFGLRMAGWPAARKEARVREILELVGLQGFDKRPVYELSGGEQQRVALARALAPMPRLLLLDEPLGALDRALRERLMLELRSILKQAGDRPEGVTALYVTHDQAEAFAVADRVAVMRAGQLEQVAPPAELYRRPASPFVARFLGMGNLLPGRIVSRDPLTVETALGNVQPAGGAPPAGEELIVLIRPDAGRLLKAPASGPNQFTGRVRALSFRGRYCQVLIEAGPEQIRLEFEQDVPLPQTGEEIDVGLDPAGILSYPAA